MAKKTPPHPSTIAEGIAYANEAAAPKKRSAKVASEAAVVRGILSGLPARSVVTFLAQTMSLAEASKMAQAIMSGEDQTARLVTHVVDVEGLDGPDDIGED